MENSQFVKSLASNNRSVRQTALESLGQYLTKKNLKQADYDKLWKGLYYSMWFCDRPRPQQRLANELGELFNHDSFYDKASVAKKADSTEKLPAHQDNFIKFCKAFWKVIILEWMKIDHHRLDKFLLMIRRVFFNQLLYLHKNEYSELLVDSYLNRVLKRFPLSGDKRVYNGIPLHIIDIFVTEWERVFKTEAEEEEEEEEGDEDDKVVTPEQVEKSCLKQMVGVLADLTKDVNVSKVLKSKIKEDILQDDTLLDWEAIPEEEEEDDDEEEGKEGQEGEPKSKDTAETEESEDEWTGF